MCSKEAIGHGGFVQMTIDNGQLGMKKTIIIFILLLIGNLYAQTVTPLRVGTIINGYLQPEQEIWYSVRATERGILTVETTGNLDTHIGFYDANRSLIKEDHDSGGNNNASINVFTVRGATYLFRLTGAVPDESGAFRIFAVSSPMPSMTDLRFGDLTNGVIRGKEENWFRYRATQSGIITVETHGDTDTVMRAFSQNLVLLSEDDDSGDELNARLELFVIQGRTYYFVVTGYYAGAYQIIAYNIRDLPAPIRRLEIATTSTTPIPSLLKGNLEIATTIGYISPGQESWYSVQTTGRGRMVPSASGTMQIVRERLIVETTGNTMLYAYNEYFEQIAFGDSGGAMFNARVELTVRPNQTYFFKVVGWLDFRGEYGIVAFLVNSE